MKFLGNRLYLLMPPVFAGMAVFVLLLGLGGATHVAEANGPLGPCFARTDVGGSTVYASSTFTSVQAAVDELGAGGGTVLIAGTCAGVQERESISQTVYISAPLTLRGGYTNTNWTVSDPTANPTVLDAEEDGRVIYATAALTVENLTIQNGSLGDEDGGGVFVDSTLAMTGTHILSNTVGDDGGGVSVSGAATVVNSRFENNTAGDDGGGLYANSTLDMRDTQVLSNTVGDDGGGVYVGGAATVVNSRFENNHSPSGFGGAISVFSTLAITDTTVLSNSSAGFGGGLYVDEGLSMTGTQVLNNTANGQGGGAWVGRGATVINSRFESNQNTSSYGGGLHMETGTLDMSGTHVLSNTASAHGGGVYARKATTVVDSYIKYNTSKNNSGGGLYIDSTLDMTGTHVLSNTAYLEGGGAYASGATIIVGGRIEQNQSLTEYAGGLGTDSTLDMISTDVLSNTAQKWGGGIYATEATTIANSLFENNLAIDSAGGGVDVDSTLYMTGTYVISNTAKKYGGGITAHDVTVIINSHIENNQSTDEYGGGLYTGSTLDMTGTHVLSNTAYFTGGGVYAGDAANVVDSTIEKNRSENGRGGGLYTDSTLGMTGTDVISNTAHTWGGGVFAVAATTVVDGRFENNRAIGINGGGLYADSTLYMTGTHVISNTAKKDGGGIRAHGNTTLENVLIERNQSIGNVGDQFGAGGGLSVGGTLDMTDTQVLNNQAYFLGGGVSVNGATTIVGSQIHNNQTTGVHYSMDGSSGGLYAQSTLHMSDTTVLSNTSHSSGGGLYANDATIINSRIENNESTDNKGGGVLAGLLLTIKGSKVISNTSDGPGGGMYMQSSLVMNDTQVLNNTANGNGGGIAVRGPATIVDSNVENNRSLDGYGGGGMSLSSSSEISRTHVLSNTAKGDGGGVWCEKLTVADSRFEHNLSTNGDGGGIYNSSYFSGDTLEVTNSLIVSNTASYGGGIAHSIYASGFTINLTNSTLASNHAITAGGGISTTDLLTITNSILWDNSPDQAAATGASSVVTRSIIQGGELGGIDTDPLFIRDSDRAAGDLGDLHLTQYSPGIDAGDDDLVPASITKDLDGNDRFFDVDAVDNNGDNDIDMGAYELNRQFIDPVADAGGPYSCDEGSTISLDGSGSSASEGVSIAEYAWDCTDDGVFDLVASSPTGDSCPYPDNGSFTVRLVVTDTGGYSGTGTAAATVNNVVPEVTAPADQSATEGVSKTFALGLFTDAGVNDNPWQVTVNWGDGSPDTTSPRDAQGDLPDKPHTYAKSGDYTVKVTVTDKDGDPGSDTFKVTVANVAPVVTAPSDQTASEGASKSFALGSFADPGADSPWQVTVKWGDGSANNQFDVNSPGDLSNRSHTYGAAGEYTVTVKVDDGDAIGRDTFRVAVTQDTGGVEGTVYEDKNGNGKPDDGEGVPGASVTLSKVSAAAFTNPVTTNADGDYAFSDVPVGDYKLTVTAEGYKSPPAVSVTVKKDATEPVGPIALELGVDDLSVYLPAVQSTSATSAGKVRGQRPALDRDLFLPAIVR